MRIFCGQNFCRLFSLIDRNHMTLYAIHFTLSMLYTDRRELDYDEVFNQTGPTNSTVYCGGILTDLTGNDDFIW